MGRQGGKRDADGRWDNLGGGSVTGAGAINSNGFTIAEQQQHRWLRRHAATASAAAAVAGGCTWERREEEKEEDGEEKSDVVGERMWLGA